MYVGPIYLDYFTVPQYILLVIAYATLLTASVVQLTAALRAVLKGWLFATLLLGLSGAVLPAMTALVPIVGPWFEHLVSQLAWGGYAYGAYGGYGYGYGMMWWMPDFSVLRYGAPMGQSLGMLGTGAALIASGLIAHVLMPLRTPRELSESLD